MVDRPWTGEGAETCFGTIACSSSQLYIIKMLNIIYVPLELHISPTVQCAVHFDKLITFIFHYLDVGGYWCDGSWASGQWARDISLLTSSWYQCQQLDALCCQCSMVHRSALSMFILHYLAVSTIVQSSYRAKQLQHMICSCAHLILTICGNLHS